MPHRATVDTALGTMGLTVAQAADLVNPVLQAVVLLFTIALLAYRIRNARRGKDEG